MKLIQYLYLKTYPVGENGWEDKENTLNVVMWHDETNICEIQDHECLTKQGIYFGTEDSREPKFCPRHYFGETGYKIELLTEPLEGRCVSMAHKDDIEKHGHCLECSRTE